MSEPEGPEAPEVESPGAFLGAFPEAARSPGAFPTLAAFPT